MKPIEQTHIWKFMERLMSWILIICGVCLILVIAVSVIMRYCLESTLFGYEEILALAAIWLYWIGGAYGSYEDSHISADMTNLLIRNEKIRHIYHGFVRILTAVITGVFAYWSIFNYAIPNFKAGTRTTGLRIPMIYSRIAITIAFVLMFIYSIYHLVRYFKPLETTGEETMEDVEE